MKLIIGLGNPGEKYYSTWHNAGFLALDEIRKQGVEKFSPFKLNKKIKAEISQGEALDEKIILVKPQTFMNNSGQATGALANFYKIKTGDIWIIHDDIDLPLGKIRISHGASSAGHRGVQSIIDIFKSNEMIRFRIGISTEGCCEMPAEEYVLLSPSQLQAEKFQEGITAAAQAVEMVLMSGLTEAMNEYN